MRKPSIDGAPVVAGQVQAEMHAGQRRDRAARAKDTERKRRIEIPLRHEERAKASAKRRRSRYRRIGIVRTDTIRALGGIIAPSLLGQGDDTPGHADPRDDAWQLSSRVSRPG